MERGDDFLIRDIEWKGESAREKITFTPQEKVVFTRLSGPADGFIVNEILEDEQGELQLAFSFALQLKDAPSGSAIENDYKESMRDAYLKAVGATLAAIRKGVKEGQL